MRLHGTEPSAMSRAIADDDDSDDDGLYDDAPRPARSRKRRGSSGVIRPRQRRRG